MIMDKRREIEGILVHWRKARREEEWRQEYYFDCGSLGIVRLFYGRKHWECRWLDIEPCPIPKVTMLKWEWAALWKRTAKDYRRAFKLCALVSVSLWQERYWSAKRWARAWKAAAKKHRAHAFYYLKQWQRTSRLFSIWHESFRLSEYWARAWKAAAKKSWRSAQIYKDAWTRQKIFIRELVEENDELAKYAGRLHSELMQLKVNASIDALRENEAKDL